MNFKNSNFQPIFLVGIVPQSSQTKSTNQSEKDIGHLAGIFVTFIIIGFLLGCFLRYKNCQKLRHQHSKEIICTIKSLDNIQEPKPDIAQNTTTERKQQIEILERIWKKSS